ncbi:MAG: hypothetical protein J5699_01470 [Bacteroidales bacterium]|nr:hypothetical protein [Bacteroidales bacterium]
MNHLGLRNAAEDLFTLLIPGLNGVTQRVRYYSFYCWITGEFIRLYSEQNHNKAEEYRLFIRKSELLLALIQAHRDPSIIGIPGITFALSTIASGDSIIDLLKCVDRPDNNRRTEGTYWANPGGILRQYYSASMKDLALLPSLQNFPSMSVPSQASDNLPEGIILGEDLGKAFGISIGKETAEKFISCVQRSRVIMDDLDAMKENLVMKDFDDIGFERELLIDMLNQKDFPANESDNRFLRRDTIKLFLKYCKNDRKEGKDAIMFPTVTYQKVLAGEADDDCSLGWYAYHINDRWQYHMSVIFSCLLEMLQKEGGWVAIKDIAGRLAKGMYNAFVSKPSITLGEVCELINKGELSRFEFGTIEEEAADAMVSLLTLYCENRNQFEIVEAYKEAFRELRRSDFFSLMTELDGLLEAPFESFLIEFITTKIIYRHHTVSLMKYSATRVASNKFLMEDGFIRFLEQTECSATAPRIDSLIEYLTDLGLLKDMMPTPDAIQRYELN